MKNKTVNLNTKYNIVLIETDILIKIIFKKLKFLADRSSKKPIESR